MHCSIHLWWKAIAFPGCGDDQLLENLHTVLTETELAASAVARRTEVNFIMVFFFFMLRDFCCVGKSRFYYFLFEYKSVPAFTALTLSSAVDMINVVLARTW